MEPRPPALALFHYQRRASRCEPDGWTCRTRDLGRLLTRPPSARPPCGREWRATVPRAMDHPLPTQCSPAHHAARTGCRDPLETGWQLEAAVHLAETRA